MGFSSVFKGLKEKQKGFYLVLLKPFLPNIQEMLDLLHGRSEHGFSYT
jgi:hypothetical protein